MKGQDSASARSVVSLSPELWKQRALARRAAPLLPREEMLLCLELQVRGPGRVPWSAAEAPSALGSGGSAGHGALLWPGAAVQIPLRY